MAKFEGSIDEFTKYIGAYCRIKVMQIATKYKKTLGKCEECDSTEQLEAAHIRGKERPLIISNILSQYMEDDKIIIDLDEFQERFIEAHLPIENSIRILCKNCHRIYDSKSEIHEYIPETNEINESKNVENLAEAENTIIEKLTRNAMIKSEAIKILNSKTGSQLNSSNTLFSNINSAVDVWWLEPANEKFATGFHFILNFPDDRKLFHFKMPPGLITIPKNIFSQRNDSYYSKIYIPKSGSKFVDKKGFDFGKYLVDKVSY